MASDRWPLPPGESWGHLTLRDQLGSAGSGPVYRAWDPELGHDVLLAILADAATDSRGRDALLEGRLLAKVRHDHLAIVYGAERRQGRIGIRLEVVDGELLEHVLDHVGRFSAREAALIGIDLCDALAAMHDLGVVHGALTTCQVIRDRQGRIVVVPFGAARESSTGPCAVNAGPHQGVPPEERLSQGGNGRALAAHVSVRHPRPTRAGDVYRIGSVLHRLVAGVAPEHDDRALSDIRSDLPLGFIRTVERARALHPGDRFSDVGALRLALTALWAPPSTPVPRTRALWAPRVLAAVVTAVAVTALGMGLGAWLTRQPAPAEVRFDLQPSGGDAVESVAFSSDGQRLAYTSGGRLWVRRLNDDASIALEPSSGARNPFFSADGQHVYYFGGVSLWRVASTGGEPQAVGAARRPSTGASGIDGSVVYSVENGSAIMLIPRAGAARALRTQMAGVRTDLRWPLLVGGGSHVVYSAIDAGSGRRGLRIGRVDAPETSADAVLLDLETNAVASADHLLYVWQGELVARRFDLGRLRLVGPAATLARGIVTDPYGDGQVELTVSRTGAVAFVGGASMVRTLRVLDAAGRTVVDLARGDIRDLRVSPDGAQVAYEQIDPATGGRDIWVVATSGGDPRQVSRHPAHDVAPTWSPDGESLHYLSFRRSPPVLITSTAQGEQERFAFDRPAMPYDVSPDGRALLYEQQDQSTGWDLWTRPLAGGAPAVLLHGPANEQAPAVSPDGRWLAYSSPESEGRQVYVVPLPPDGPRLRISIEHGRQPQWAPDGRAIFYHGHDRQLMRRPFEAAAAVPHRAPAEALFRLPFRGFDVRYQYGVVGPGRFVVSEPPVLAPPIPATVILHPRLP